ncbi:hypothetical protein LJB96_02765 [Methanobrevibacter sp. OttesenSCG-928-K11]|nr:hypothetical protein [Methanobrevibacter sp. OttesenSCG-928-K11]MDL2270530.1 hypothetical protein [Methanobrevibacter sp. OttesenSCG-928-I08]
MNNELKEILRANEFFDEVEENIFTPKYLGLIVNSVVVYNVNWIAITEGEAIFMNQAIEEHPIASIILENLESLLIITEEEIKEVL